MSDTKHWSQQLVEAREGRNRALRLLAGARDRNRRLRKLLVLAQKEIVRLRSKAEPAERDRPRLVA
jgi:hypothetical protein